MTDLDRAGLRFDVFAEQVLEPAVFTGATPLDVAAAQCTDAITLESARDLDVLTARLERKRDAASGETAPRHARSAQARAARSRLVAMLSRQRLASRY